MEFNPSVSYIKPVNNNPAPTVNPQIQTASVLDTATPYNYGQGAVSALKTNALTSINNDYQFIGTVKIPFCNDARLYQLNNGQKVILVKKQGPTTIKTFFKVGAFNEPDNIRGISHFIEHNLFNGSKEQAPGEFVETINRKGAKYNASTGFIGTDYYIQSPLHRPDDLENFIRMHADMLSNPLFLEKSIEKEKGPVTSEIQMLSDDPSNIATNTALKNLFQIPTTSLDLIGGTVKNIENLKREDVLDYYNKWYTPDNMTTVIVGDVNPDYAISLASRDFNRMKPASENQATSSRYYEPFNNIIPKTVRKDLINNNIQSTLVNMTFVGPKNSDIRGTIAANALAIALAGHKNARVTKELERFNTEASIGIEAISPSLNDPQVVMLQSDFKPGTEEEGIKSIYSAIYNTVLTPPSETEMQIIKNKMIDNLSMISESSMAITDKIGHSINANGSISGYSESLNIINSLTPQDVQNAAKQFMDLNRASIAVLHPQNSNVIQLPVKQSPSNTQKTAFTGSLNSEKPINSKMFSKLDTGNSSEYTLSNNVHLVMNDNPASRLSAANIELKTDTIPQSKPGVSALLAIMLDESTAAYSKEKFAEIKDINNIKIGTNSDFETLKTETSCSPEKLPMALELMKNVLYSPDFSKEKLDKAKEQLKLAYISTPINPMDRAIETVYGNHPYGNSGRKVIENLDNITLNDITSFYNQLISGSKIRAVVTAPVSRDAALSNSVFSSLSGMPAAKPYQYNDNYIETPLTQNEVIAEAENRNQAHILQLFKIKESGNIKDHAAIIILNEILGGNSQSRLFMDLRETQKLAYRVSSHYTSTGKTGEIALEIKTTTEDGKNGRNQYENVQKSLDGFKKHINLLMGSRVPQGELDGAKLKIKSKLMFEAESSFGKNTLVNTGFSTPYGTAYSKELLKAIDTITAEDIQKAAVYYLNKPSVISLIAGKNTIEANKQYLSSLGKLNVY
jgi:zinc protease